MFRLMSSIQMRHMLLVVANIVAEINRDDKMCTLRILFPIMHWMQLNEWFGCAIVDAKGGCWLTLCWPFVSKSVQNIWPERGYQLAVSGIGCRLRLFPHSLDRAAQPSFLPPCCEMQVTSSAQKRYLVVHSCIIRQDFVYERWAGRVKHQTISEIYFTESMDLILRLILILRTVGSIPGSHHIPHIQTIQTLLHLANACR